MLRTLNLSNRFIRAPPNSHSIRRLYHRKEFVIQSDYFDTHPIDRQTIDALAKLDSERKSRANITIVRNLFSEYENESDNQRKNELSKKLRSEFKKFPNQTHPAVLSYGNNATNVEIESHGDAFKKKNPADRDYATLSKLLNSMRLEQLGNFTGSRSYYLMHGLAELVSENSILTSTHRRNITLTPHLAGTSSHPLHDRFFGERKLQFDFGA